MEPSTPRMVTPSRMLAGTSLACSVSSMAALPLPSWKPMGMVYLPSFWVIFPATAPLLGIVPVILAPRA